MTREQYIQHQLEEAESALEFQVLSTEEIAMLETARSLYASLLNRKSDPMERIAHALEVIAANVGMIEQHTALTEGNRSIPATSERMSEIVNKIKNGGNY